MSGLSLTQFLLVCSFLFFHSLSDSRAKTTVQEFVEHGCLCHMLYLCFLTLYLRFIGLYDGILFFHFLLYGNKLTIDLLKIPFCGWHPLLLAASNASAQAKGFHSKRIVRLPTFHCHWGTDVLGREPGSYFLFLVGAFLDICPAFFIKDDVAILVSFILSDGNAVFVEPGLLFARFGRFMGDRNNCDVQMRGRLVHVQDCRQLLAEPVNG